MYDSIEFEGRRCDMSHPGYQTGEVAKRGKELYDLTIGPLIETEVNIGRIAPSILEPETMKSETI